VYQDILGEICTISGLTTANFIIDFCYKRT